jgi:hypothetical protein
MGRFEPKDAGLPDPKQGRQVNANRWYPREQGENPALEMQPRGFGE